MANRHVTALERDYSPLAVFGNNTARKIKKPRLRCVSEQAAPY